jgi:eukaryotic-like serine/threonine-protein kinase
VLGEVGRGAMGVVYKARQEGLGRLVALKMILSGSQASPDQRQRFLREAETVAKLQHPNVVQIYEIGSHEGNAFLALEFIDGPTLSQHCNHKPQAPAGRPRWWRCWRGLCTTSTPRAWCTAT